MTVEQSRCDAIGETMISRLPRGRLPFFRIAPDDFDGHVITPDLNIYDMIDSTSSFYFHQFIAKCDGSLDRSLRVILDRVMLDIGIENLERLRDRPPSIGICPLRNGTGTGLRPEPVPQPLSPFCSEWLQLQWTRNQFHEALFTFEDRRRSRHAQLCQH